LDVHVVVMHVESCDKHWQEERIRKRRWVSPKKAASLVFREEQVSFLKAALKIVNSSNAGSQVAT
jgi:hypothetical protein